MIVLFILCSHDISHDSMIKFMLCYVMLCYVICYVTSIIISMIAMFSSSVSFYLLHGGRMGADILGTRYVHEQENISCASSAFLHGCVF